MSPTASDESPAANLRVDLLHDAVLRNPAFSSLPEVLRVLPLLFMILCFILFALPLWVIIHMSMDFSVQYWISSYLWIVLVLPPVYMLTFAVHRIKRGPSKVFVLASLLGSCALFLLLGICTLVRAQRLHRHLSDNSCDSLHDKRLLEDEWQKAYQFYSSCLNSRAKDENLKMVQAVNAYSIADCPGYERALAERPSWKYLNKLEQTHVCGGWCSRAKTMWTSKQAQGSCSAVVADILQHKVATPVVQVIVYCLLVLAFAVGILVSFWPFVVKSDIKG